VDPDLYALSGADVREDSITYHFQGVKSVADHAWVVRFSQKSTEQNPDSLMNVAALLPLIAAGKRGMSLLEEAERVLGDLKVRYIRYRFDSPVRDAEGKPFPAHGIIAAVRQETSGGTVVYHMKLDNHGDRDEVTVQDLKPFLEPIAG